MDCLNDFHFLPYPNVMFLDHITMYNKAKKGKVTWPFKEAIK